MEGHALKCVEIHRVGKQKKLCDYKKLQVFALVNHQFKKKELESVGELPYVDDIKMAGHTWKKIDESF